VNTQRELSGILFPNDRKSTEKQPDLKGSVTVNGQEFYVSGWKKQGARGEFVSLALTPKSEQREAAPADNAEGEDDRYAGGFRQRF